MLLEAGTLAQMGRFPEAKLAFSQVASAPSGRTARAEAWEGVALCEAAEGHPAEAARSWMLAWDESSGEGRKKRHTDLVSALSRVPLPELRGLSRESGAGNSRELVLAELRQRGDLDHGASVTVLAPLSGRLAEFGADFVLGARLALEDGAGGDSLPPRLVVRDTGGSLPVALSAARAAIREDRSVAIIGPLLSSSAHGVGAMAAAWDIPVLAPLAGDPRLSMDGSGVFTLAPPASALASPLAEAAVHVLGYHRLGVLLPEGEDWAAFEEAFRLTAESLGAQVLLSLVYDPSETDFRNPIDRLEAESVEAVYFPGGVAELEKLVPQLGFYDFTPRVFGNGPWLDPRVLDSGNSALQGAVFAAERAELPESDFRMRLSRAVHARSHGEVTRFHVGGYRAMADLLTACAMGTESRRALSLALKLRNLWESPPDAAVVETVTFRDGVFGPVEWAARFNLPPEPDPEPPPQAKPVPEEGEGTDEVGAEGTVDGVEDAGEAEEEVEEPPTKVSRNPASLWRE